MYAPAGIDAAQTGVSKAKSILNKPIMVPSVRPIESMKTPNIIKQAASFSSYSRDKDKEREEREKDKELGVMKYLPFLVGGTTLGLGAKAVANKGFRHAGNVAFKGAVKGLTQVAGKLPPVKWALNSLENGFKGSLNHFESNIQKGTLLPTKKLNDRARQALANENDIAFKIAKKWGEDVNKYSNKYEQNFKGAFDQWMKYIGNDIKKTNPEAFNAKREDFARRFAKNYTKENVMPKPPDREELRKVSEKMTEDLKNPKPTPQNDSIHNIIGGLGQGLAFTTGAFGMQLAADEYFRRKDNDELRQTLRKSMNKDNSNDRSDDRNYTPKQLANRIAIKHMADNDTHRHASDADLEAEKLARSPWHERTKIRQAVTRFVKSQEFQDNIIGSAKQSMMNAAIPAGIGIAINRDLKGDLHKLRDPNGNAKPGRIVIDIPIEDKMSKSAALSDKTRAILDKDGLQAAIRAVRARKPKTMPSNPTINKSREALKAEAWRAAKVIAWTLPPAAVVALTGRNVRGNFEKMNKQDKLQPIKPGMARVTIETGDKHYSNNDMQQMR